jgi:hypothetical protein
MVIPLAPHAGPFDIVRNVDIEEAFGKLKVVVVVDVVDVVLEAVKFF